jgi:prepilin-type N-terminal cleavage/methylation domain-containing protein
MLKKLRNKKGFTLAELLIVVAIIGVLVAISIPIFTSQLKKARLATNQANARAAYAAATTQYMLKYADTAPTTDTVTYLYTVSKGTGDFQTAAETADLLATATDAKSGSDISKWEITTTSNSKALGDETAKTWTVVLNKDGTINGYKAGF